MIFLPDEFIEPNNAILDEVVLIWACTVAPILFFFMQVCLRASSDHRFFFSIMVTDEHRIEVEDGNVEAEGSKKSHELKGWR